MALLPLLFDGHAFVIAVGIPCVAGAALAAEIGPAVPAEQLGGQQIIVLGFVNCTPFVRQCGILSNKWGDFICQRESQTKGTHQNSRNW